MAKPVFQMPFYANQSWRASTYDDTTAETNHWPNSNSIDLVRILGNNEINSEGQVVVASADGTVAEVGPVYDPDTDEYYGDYVYIDHEDGWQTMYLHIIKSSSILVDNTVVRGQRLGTIGKYLTMGVHLHFTQLKDGVAVRIAFSGTLINVHKDAKLASGKFPTQVIISHNHPSGCGVKGVPDGASASCAKGAAVRAVVQCLKSSGMEYTRYGPWVAAKATSVAKGAPADTVTDMSFETT